MALERINPPEIYKPNKDIYTQVVTATGSTQIFLAGIVPFDQNQNIIGIGNMQVQVIQVLLIFFSKSLEESVFNWMSAVACVRITSLSNVN